MTQKPTPSMIVTESCDHELLNLSIKQVLFLQLKYFQTNVENKGWWCKIVSLSVMNLSMRSNQLLPPQRMTCWCSLTCIWRITGLLINWCTQERCARILTCISTECSHIHKRELPTLNRWTCITVRWTKKYFCYYGWKYSLSWTALNWESLAFTTSNRG